MESCKENLSDGLFWSDKSLASCMEKTKSFRSCAPKLVVVDTFQKENFDCEATDLSWIEAMLSTQDCVQGDLQKTAALGSDVTKDSDKKPSRWELLCRGMCLFWYLISLRNIIIRLFCVSLFNSNSGVTIREGTDTFFKEIPDLSFMLESTLSIPPGVDANHIFNLESPI